MSKFFLTNDEALYRRSKDLLNKSIFKKSFEYKNENLFLITTAKLDITNVNSYSDGKDFAFATGTFIYKKSNDRKILFENRNDSIDNIRKDSIGHYCVGLKSGDKVTLFGAAYAAYNIFYYHDAKKFLIGNDLYSMAKILKGNVSINRLNAVEEFAHTILCNETIFNEIFRLDGNEYIEINREKIEICHQTFQPVPIQEPSVKMVKGMANCLKEKAKIISTCLGAPSICMTAGLDARISLATYLSVGVKPNLYYGVGNSFLTNTQNKDLEIDYEFQKRFNLNFSPLKWDSPTQIDQDWEQLIDEYGFHAEIYGGSKDIHLFFRQLKGPVITFGYGGEMYRNLDWIENRKKDFFTIDNFIDEYYITGDIRDFVKGVPGFREHLSNKLKQICKKYNLDPQHIRNEDNLYFLQEYRKTADTTLLNFINWSKYCSLLLMESECLFYGRQHIAPLKQSKFMLSVINELHSDVLNIPVFSHCTLRKYNKESGVLEYPQQSTKTKVKIKLKNICPKIIWSLIKKIVPQKDFRPILPQITSIEPHLNFDKKNDYRDTVKCTIFHKIFERLISDDKNLTIN